MAKKIRILIIDDEKDMRVYLDAVFARPDTRPRARRTEKRGSGWLDPQPDLITLDMLMPKSRACAPTGVCARRKKPGLPIVVLTGLTRLDDFFGDLGDLPGPDEMVEKPIDREAFMAKVEGILGD